MADEAIFIGGDKTILLKKAIARALYSKGIDQSKISEILSLSQPMVSNYCGSTDKIPKNILDLAEKTSYNIINGSPVTFHTCVSFSYEPYEGSYFIANKNELISDEKTRVIDNLAEAFLLMKGKDIAGLVPKVKINIAMAREKAENSGDIAAFLNGLIIADDRVTSYNGVRFGKSKHLSSLLLYLKENIDINAIMNIAYIKDASKTGFTYSFLTKDFKLDGKKKDVDVLLHKGDFGIEPCAYILGKDAVDVVNKVMKIKEEIK